MEFDLLKAFCQLAKSGNYRLASEQLYITQSALTKKIQRLESNIGASLFSRGRNGAELTHAGKTLLAEAQRLVHSMQAFEQLSDSVVNGTQGHLNIGFGVSTYHEAPKLIATYKQQYPDVHITLNDTPSKQQTDELSSHDLDISFNRIPESSDLESLTLFNDSLVVAIHKDLLKQAPSKNLVVSELSKWPYLKLTQHRGPGLDRQIQQYCLANKIDLSKTQEADDILTLLALVSANIGFTIVPNSAQFISNTDVAFIALEGEYATWPVGLIWNGKSENPLRDRFVEFVANQKEN
ncbi:LysR family transcriptional regulator [Vibrio crassostreae]|uniref:LysR family transcriptional regulator n=1 Tax=Vibrio crassostreae TaxID=246167 RepID=UPI000F461195|nr:LysR family transcriptional regulator [Vibrio crassostreae]ROO54277.1 LysR family transcriptional regulator [Vibrio crassostreae]ROO65246.1 LysR family transcriptional regulator [Vibrio crassostreae]ROO69251.1 LysR family transcriptional regulator [Vibrio crassostreae]ROO70816.1 LysR family transcriptional regulator [Vibrio crassostreae]ROR63801.1 LysR family transcriptional regulator [Vibrio crassostreae]